MPRRCRRFARVSPNTCPGYRYSGSRRLSANKKFGRGGRTAWGPRDPQFFRVEILPRRRGSSVDEQGYRRSETVQEFLPADRADLPRAVEAGQGQAPKFLRYQRRVVIGDREQPRPPPVTGEEQSPLRRLAGLALEERPKILVGGGRVPHVELDGLPHLD